MPSPTLSAFGLDQRIVVGMAEVVVSNNPGLTLATYSLGSCLGISIYDPVTRVGGILHAMLPDSSIAQDKARAKPGMFLDSGLPRLLDSARQLRFDAARAVVCVAGGAQILDSQGYFNIGRRNLDALDMLLRQAGLKVAAAETGGTVNRTLYLKLASGEVRLKSSAQPAETLLWRP